jgi:hypothetical protein
MLEWYWFIYVGDKDGEMSWEDFLAEHKKQDAFE